MLFLAYELGYWLNHYLSHRIAFLWEFHKVHHTATVLTPLTNFRVHPVYMCIFLNILSLFTGLANGVGDYLFGQSPGQYGVNETNLILVFFIYLYVHLQHTQLWIPFTGWLGRVFMSPAHHQIHHSSDPAHFNKNMGSCLALVGLDVRHAARAGGRAREARLRRRAATAPTPTPSAAN